MPRGERTAVTRASGGRRGGSRVELPGVGALRYSRRRLSGQAWRVVEAQHVVSTRKLVDDLDEQELLEELIDGVKPPLPADEVDHGRLHWLLATPFRYPPLRYGSRFGRRHERGIWYGSLAVPTALAETAYYRLVFLEGTAADLSLQVELTVFSAAYDSARAVDLTRPPFDRHIARISSPIDYTVSQALGTAMREQDVELLRFRSARDPRGGDNLALLSPRALATRRPGRQETWMCHASRPRVDFVRMNLAARRATLSFPRSVFEVGGRLPSPAT
ncbi:MAG TPA: RES family NAD+ phosphorylase [Kofleriaceae bacterium]|nr:RES family NAD+ phosphorylase [Kofleriaceae bacterium]